MTSSPPTRPRARFSHHQSVQAPPEAVFPLLCPQREYDWIPGWECRMVYSESGLAEAGCVFQTASDGVDTWVVSRYDPPRRITFIRVNSLRCMEYDIQLHAVESHTRLTWTQMITALDELGDRHVNTLREEAFVESVTRIEQLLRQYLDPCSP